MCIVTSKTPFVIQSAHELSLSGRSRPGASCVHCGKPSPQPRAIQREDVLMKVDDRVDAVGRRCVDDRVEHLEIALALLTFERLYASPHEEQANHVDAPSGKLRERRQIAVAEEIEIARDHDVTAHRAADAALSRQWQERWNLRRSREIHASQNDDAAVLILEVAAFDTEFAAATERAQIGGTARYLAWRRGLLSGLLRTGLLEVRPAGDILFTP